MNRILIFIILILLNSCSLENKLKGIYYYEGTTNGFSKEYLLKLEKQTFKLNFYTHDASPKCIGRFYVIKDSLFLKCNKEESVFKTITSGYMNQRDYKLKIINHKKLLMLKENIILSK